MFSLVTYLTGISATGVLYLLMNIPLLVMAAFGVSRRFLLYSIVSVVWTSLVAQYCPFSFTQLEPLQAALAGGVAVGAGSGIVLRSLGSNGGLDIVAVFLNQKFSLPIGRFFFLFNFALYVACFGMFEPNIVIDSIVLAFVTSITMEEVMSLFNQRKMVFVISNEAEPIAQAIIEKLGMSATLLNGTGAYMKRPRHMLMTIIHNIQLKRLEEIVFSEDPEALFIVENTFSVLGGRFPGRKVY